MLQSLIQTLVRVNNQANGGADAKFQQLYSMNSTRLAKECGLFVGHERVNSTKLVERIMKMRLRKLAPSMEAPSTIMEADDNEMEEELHLNEIHILDTSIDQINFYLTNKERREKEAMAKAYLQASAFRRSLLNILNKPTQ